MQPAFIRVLIIATRFRASFYPKIGVALQRETREERPSKYPPKYQSAPSTTPLVTVLSVYKISSSYLLMANLRSSSGNPHFRPIRLPWALLMFRRSWKTQCRSIIFTTKESAVKRASIRWIRKAWTAFLFPLVTAPTSMSRRISASIACLGSSYRTTTPFAVVSTKITTAPWTSAKLLAVPRDI